MRLARVLGPVWATQKHPAYSQHTLLLVQPIDANGADSGPAVVAVDRAQAGVNDRVLVLTEGTGVRQILAQGDLVPIRSVIVGIVDAVDVPTSAPRAAQGIS